MLTILRSWCRLHPQFFNQNLNQVPFANGHPSHRPTCFVMPALECLNSPHTVRLCISIIM
uniref:Uncharacterized protein n=1 Tax=Arundo donax TaxID=35708 RepID=A0A0A9FIP5_ARUDO